MTTFLVTGATGYIAKYIVLQLLEDGHDVVGSSRSADRDAEMRAALGPHLPEGALDRYRTVALDLTEDAGWDAAMEGIDVLIHTASPFPIAQPDDAQELIRPAVDGARRALDAAARAGIDKVVFTSSTVSVCATHPPEGHLLTEDDWTNPDDDDVSAYGKSKTLAERAAWDVAKEKGLRLTVINPSFVQGPPLDQNYGSSVKVTRRMLKSKDPALPKIGFLTCDVRDVARAHVVAATSDVGEGHRHIIVDRFMTMPEMARVIDEALPDRKITTRIAPNWLMRGIALFDSELKAALPILDRTSAADNSRMKNVLGIMPRDVRQSVADTALKLVEFGE